MKRRQFLKTATVIPAALAACKKKVTAPAVEPDFVLQGDETTLAMTARDQLPLLQRMVESGNGKLMIGIPTDDGDKILTMEVVKGGAVSYHHIRLSLGNQSVPLPVDAPLSDLKMTSSDG